MAEATIEINKEELDARRCARIINKKSSGAVFDRNLEPTAKWPILYAYAKLNQDEFDVEYDSDIAPVDSKGDVIYDNSLLRTKNMPELHKIGSKFGVTGRSKDEIISRILKAQG